MDSNAEKQVEPIRLVKIKKQSDDFFILTLENIKKEETGNNIHTFFLNRREIVNLAQENLRALSLKQSEISQNKVEI